MELKNKFNVGDVISIKGYEAVIISVDGGRILGKTYGVLYTNSGRVELFEMCIKRNDVVTLIYKNENKSFYRLPKSIVSLFDNKTASGVQILRDAFLLMSLNNIDLNITVTTLKSSKTYDKDSCCNVLNSSHVDYINPTSVFESELILDKKEQVSGIVFTEKVIK